jgi:hypothetical protein
MKCGTAMDRLLKGLQECGERKASTKSGEIIQWKSFGQSVRTRLPLTHHTFEVSSNQSLLPLVHRKCLTVQLKLPKTTLKYFSEDVGDGVFAAEDIQANQPVLVYGGQVTTSKVQHVQAKTSAHMYSHMRTSLADRIFNREADDYCLDGRQRGKLAYPLFPFHFNDTKR